MPSDLVFKEKEKKPLSFLEVGKSGTLVTGDIVQHTYLNEFLGIEGQELCRKILDSDSQARKIFHALFNPIKSADWSIEPASDDDFDLEVAALIEHIIFNDIPDGFIGKLDEICPFAFHGHAVFFKHFKNREHKIFGQYTGLENLAFRDQRTLDKWHYTDAGKLEKIHQIQNGDIPVDVWMDADDLMIFYNEKKGSNTGYPFARMLYGNYKRKLLYKQLQAIGIEKGAIGVPILILPPDAEPESDAYTAAVSQLEEYTQAENSYIILPHGYDLKLDQSNIFDPSKVQVAIKAENEEMAGTVVAMFLEMGIGGNSAVGSSTSESIKFFMNGITYLANKIANPFNLNLIPQLVYANFGDKVEVMPKLKYSGITDTDAIALMKVVTGYAKDGIITPDEPLEDHIRKKIKLPPKAEGEMLANQTSEEKLPQEKDDDAEKENAIEVKSEKSDDEIEFNSKGKSITPKELINQQSVVVADDIKNTLKFAAEKYINDTLNRYRQLPDAKKQNATNKTIIAGKNRLKKSLKTSLTATSLLSIDMAKKEVPTTKEIKLSNKPEQLVRLSNKYGELEEIKFSSNNDLPAYVQALILKQADLISEASLAELKSRLDFSFSSTETRTNDENIIKQAMQDDADEFITSNKVSTKATNVSSLTVNESRGAYFFEDDVLEEIHSFTFMNDAPVAAVCRELAGVTFNTNDAQSLFYSPPLHHNCKSFLRANLKVSKGVDDLEISVLAPTAKAQKSITL